MPDTKPVDASCAPIRFGPNGRFELQPAQFCLLIDGQPAPVGGRALDLLLVLASRPNELISKNELIERVWPDVIVEENNLRVQVNSLRKLLGDEVIVTVPGRGYRFAAPMPARETPVRPVTAAVAGVGAAPGAGGAPFDLDAFVGRELELAALTARLQAGDRLVTVVGPGGAGKTRFVRRHAALQSADWAGGVHFCDLSEARSLNGLAAAVASGLGATLGAADPIPVVGDLIAARGACVVILDNFEQVVEHAAATLGPWMSKAPLARFVVTSRERLNLVGEHFMTLGALGADVDGNGDSNGNGDGDGVRLFELRARARRPDFALTPANRHDVSSIVTLLDGLPLAIELAAARASLFSPAQLCQRLQQGLALLANPRSPHPRHATMRASIDWSWQLLEPWEQAALAQCSVFAGTFTVQAAEAVIDLSAWPAAPLVVDVMQSLLDSSLLRSLAPFAGRTGELDVPYFSLFVSVREFAAEQLERGELGDVAAEAARSRHGRHYAGLGCEANLDATDRHGGEIRLAQMAADLENLVAAARHALRIGNASVAALTTAACQRLLESRGPFQLSIELGRALLEVPGLSDRERAAATLGLAQAYRLNGQPDLAESLMNTALQTFRELGDRRGEGRVLLVLGSLQLNLLGDTAAAGQNLSDALALFVEAGDRPLQAAALGGLASVTETRGQTELAEQQRWEAVLLHREAGNRRMEAHELCNVVNRCILSDRLEEALVHTERALDLARACEDRRVEGHLLGNRAGVFIEQGQLSDARRDLDDALRIARETGNRRFESNMRRNLGDLLSAEGQLGAAVDQYESARVLALGAGYKVGEARAVWYLASALQQHGQPGRAQSEYERAIALMEPCGTPPTLCDLLCEYGLCKAAAGDIGAAHALLLRALAVAEQAALEPDPSLVEAFQQLKLVTGHVPQP